MASLRRWLVMVVAALVAAVAASPAGAIVGGDDVPDGRYRWMVSLQDDDGHFCGGTLVAPRWVLTAAHCVVDAKPHHQDVVVGRTDLEDTSRGRRVRVEGIRVHPRYEDTGTYDVALLRLARSVSLPTIPIATSTHDRFERAGTRLKVTGWGASFAYVGPAPTRLQVADVEAVSDTDCDTTMWTLGFNPPTEVCAEMLLADSCHGDSGGPLFRQRQDTIVQVGVVSYGLGCATPGFPGVYAETNNPSVRRFIREVTGR